MDPYNVSWQGWQVRTPGDTRYIPWYIGTIVGVNIPSECISSVVFDARHDSVISKELLPCTRDVNNVSVTWWADWTELSFDVYAPGQPFDWCSIGLSPPYT